MDNTERNTKVQKLGLVKKEFRGVVNKRVQPPQVPFSASALDHSLFTPSLLHSFTESLLGTTEDRAVHKHRSTHPEQADC